MRKILLLLIIFMASTFSLAAQQIPKIGVINYKSIISEYLNQNDEYLEVENFRTQAAEKLATVNSEVDKLVLKRDSLISAKKIDDKSLDEIQSMIDERKAYIVKYEEYRDTVLAEKEKAAKDALSGKLSRVLNEIQFIAESEGYSIIFDSNDKNIKWWSQSVDITDLVKKRLKK